MTGISSLGRALGDGANLVTQLRAIADDAGRAATLAHGEYLPQMSRMHELQSAFRASTRAQSALDDLLPRIATMDGGEDGLRLAQAAIDQLKAGRMVLRDGVAVEDDVVRSGGAVVDAIATGSASSMFREAAAGVRGIADIATIESTGVDDMFRAITGLS